MNNSSKHDPRDWEDDDFMLELDFTKSLPNPYANAHTGAIVVPLSDELRQEFPTAEAIEEGLKKLVEIRRKELRAETSGDAAGGA